MEIFTQLLAYFGVPLLSEASTFVELLQFFLLCVFSIFLILFVFKFLFNAVWQIQNNLMR